MSGAPALRRDPLKSLLPAETFAAVLAADALALLHAVETYDTDDTLRRHLAEPEALERALAEQMPARLVLTPLVLAHALAFAEPPLEGLATYVTACPAILGQHLEPCSVETWRALTDVHLRAGPYEASACPLTHARRAFASKQPAPDVIIISGALSSLGLSVLAQACSELPRDCETTPFGLITHFLRCNVGSFTGDIAHFARSLCVISEQMPGAGILLLDASVTTSPFSLSLDAVGALPLERLLVLELFNVACTHAGMRMLLERCAAAARLEQLTLEHVRDVDTGRLLFDEECARVLFKTLLIPDTRSYQLAGLVIVGHRMPAHVVKRIASPKRCSIVPVQFRIASE